jgi:O-antigen ligase
MGEGLKRYFIPGVIGFAPLATFLLTWDVASYGKMTSIIRALSLPELSAELAAIAIAFAEGMLPWLRQMRMSRPPAIALAALVLVAVGTVMIAPDRLGAASHTFFWIVHLCFGFSIAFLCGRVFRGSDLVRCYLLGFAAFAAAFAAFAITNFHRPLDWTRDLPAVVHIRHLGIYATAIIGLCIGLMATASRTEVWIGACAVAASGFALALWTGARGPVFAAGAAVAIGLLIAPDMRRIRAWGGTLLSLFAGLLAVIRLPVPAGNMGFARTVSATTQSGDVGTGRMALWKGVVQAIERQPLFGYGEGQMQSVAPYYTMAQPHNLVLQVLLAWGVIGLVCVCVLGFAFARMALPAIRRDPARTLAPALAMASLVALSMIDAAMYHILPLSIFAASAGVIAAAARSETATG